MRSIEYDGYLGPYLPKEVQRRRVANVIEKELTQAQRLALVGYYLQGKTLTQIALEQGVNKSTICRNLKRAENRLRMFLRY